MGLYLFDGRPHGDRSHRLIAALALVASAVAIATPTAATAKSRPDLKVVSISNPPASLGQGAALEPSVKVKNGGKAKARRSTTRFYLSPDATKSPYAALTDGSQSVPALRPRAAKGAEASLGIPLSAPLGTARLVACADDETDVKESNERNNCKAADSSIEVVAPTTSDDLIAAALENGEITAEQALLYRVYAAFGDSRLPAAYQGDDRQVFDSDALLQAAAAFDTLAPAAKDALIPFLKAPAYPGTWEELGTVSPRRSLAGPGSALKRGGDPPLHPSPLGEEGWFFFEHDRARIWFRQDNPEHQQRAALIYANLEEIHNDLTGLMGRSPVSDAGPHAFTAPDGTPRDWGDGGSGKLDIYVNRISGDRALTLTYPPGCTGRPSFMIVDPVVIPTATLARDVVAHEFMHVLQYTYTYAQPCKRYLALDEMIAHWAIDYVFPSDNFEHEYTHFLKYGNHSPEDQNDAAWPFALYIEHIAGPSVIPALYGQTQSLGPWPALNAALPGGLKKHWADFARYAWNQEPVTPAFDSWDPPLAQIPLAGYNTPLEPEKIRLVDASTPSEYPISISIRALTRAYRPYEMDGAFVHLEFQNGLVGKPGASVQALVKLRDGTWKTEDWTDEQKVEFCRTKDEEDVTDLVLIFANSTFADLNNVVNSAGTKLIASNDCLPDAFSGTVTMNADDPVYYDGAVTVTSSATVTFTRDAQTNRWFADGTVTFTTGGGADSQGCTYSGTGTYNIAVEDLDHFEEGTLFIVPREDHLDYALTGRLGFDTPTYPATRVCPNPDPPPATITDVVDDFSAGDHPWARGLGAPPLDATTLDGTYTDEIGNGSGTATWTWSLAGSE